MENLAVAKEILNQLGGGKFIVMTGVKHLAGGANSLSMNLRRNLTGANYLVITLNSLDLYDMEFISVTAKGRKVKCEVKGVYNDMLQEIFSEKTGYAKRLF